MDIKALMGGKKVPVKILVSTDEYAPVKAIGSDGTIYDIKALTPEGEPKPESAGGMADQVPLRGAGVISFLQLKCKRKRVTSLLMFTRISASPF